ncbi:hypothetical protein BCV69DRAFT_188814 [Microstroma glucosiphilum]|uniref:Uncharacterized protein n=1 Tax=Pseudomicrostroma glucosiphilum TaxID=1684307 RepID=A0A316U7I8_9BASI|nr:hypothetical protein BCV69DRAFT_188814 [Pseudomicrostroma glucosiphilum]PWN21152.1 hypothetical protein BCV69DRAFT_188814 [Pseudomicrostroma glucosiphilum]
MGTTSSRCPINQARSTFSLTPHILPGRESTGICWLQASLLHCPSVPFGSLSICPTTAVSRRLTLATVLSTICMSQQEPLTPRNLILSTSLPLSLADTVTMDSLRETPRLRKQVSDNEARWQDQVRKNQRLLRQLRDAHEDIRALQLRVEFLEERQEGRDNSTPAEPQASSHSYHTMKEALGLAVTLLDKERTQRDILATRNLCSPRARG